MPKLTMYFSRSELTPTVVPWSGLQMQSLLVRIKPYFKEVVAGACSTDGDELLPAHVDIVFMELGPHSDGGPVSFELETYGKPARKAKFGTPDKPTEAILALRGALVAALKSWWGPGLSVSVQEGFDHIENQSNPILWVKWVDPDGPHV